MLWKTPTSVSMYKLRIERGLKSFGHEKETSPSGLETTSLISLTL